MTFWHYLLNKCRYSYQLYTLTPFHHLHYFPPHLMPWCDSDWAKITTVTLPCTTRTELPLDGSTVYLTQEFSQTGWQEKSTYYLCAMHEFYVSCLGNFIATKLIICIKLKYLHFAKIFQLLDSYRTLHYSAMSIFKFIYKKI